MAASARHTPSTQIRLACAAGVEAETMMTVHNAIAAPMLGDAGGADQFMLAQLERGMEQMGGSAAVTAWDAARYDDQFGYVSMHGANLVDLLAPAAGETVLDLGCGTGELAQTIRAAGATVIGVDSDPAMVAAASARLERPAILADGHDFRLDQVVDAVFSNAALHWMTRPAEVLRCVHRSLRPHGRFVAEMGGARNVGTIIASVRAALAERGLADGMRVPWYFPSPAEYAGRLEAAGFRVTRMEYFPRPTPLVNCPNGIVYWVHMFGGHLVAHVPEPQLPQVLARAAELAEPKLRKPDGWYADYWRLRFVAVAEPAAGSERRGFGSPLRV